ncbi:MAG TPA: hypothetical protein VLY21_05855 [Nitrososphaerales archaeon]|nr:hypothetical protein [Nitrososphaerales archaeon]
MEATSQLRRVLNVVPHGKEYTVVANLPKNSVSLAVQAEQAGADAILMNVDGEDGNYSGHFGSYDLHDAYINDALSTVSIPCGIGIGGAKPLTEEYWERIMSTQFSFVEMYAHQMPLFVMSDDRVKKVVAIATGYILEQVKELSRQEGVDALDVAIVPPQARGNPFSALDYSTLHLISELSARPLLLRTQKRLTPGDVGRVLKLGVKGLVVDPCILSGTDETYKEELAGLVSRRPGPE